jgi:hypothetical protein
MILCTFSWPIQTHLAVPQNEGFFFSMDGRNVYIDCQTLPGTKLFSYTGEEYGWLTKEYEVISRYIQVVSTSDKKVPVRQIHRKKDEASFTGGTADPVKYTRISVTFEVESTDVLDDETSFNELKAWVERVAQHFVDLYRIATQENDVVRLRIKDAPAIDVLVADDYEFNAEVLSGNFRLYKWVQSWEEATKVAHFKETMQPERTQVLLELLQSGFSPHIHDRLLLDAKEQSFVRNEHDMAIVIAETAFETFLQARLINWCAANSKATLKVGKGKGEKDLPYQEAIEGASVSTNLDFVEEFSSQKIKGGAEYGNWHKHAFTARNGIVHLGIRGAAAEDAGKAFTAVVTFIEFINQVLR